MSSAQLFNLVWVCTVEWPVLAQYDCKKHDKDQSEGCDTGTSPSSNINQKHQQRRSIATARFV